MKQQIEDKLKTVMAECDGNEIILDNGSLEKRKRKPGIIYLGTLPPYMNVTKVKEIFSRFGPLGRIFLQPAETNTGGRGKRKKPPIHFSEGWIEFESKRVAKLVASTLNNTQIGGKKSSKFYDYMWNIKYLPRFKWVHLSERLAYEKAVHRQKLRAEIAQAKREANFFVSNVEKSKRSKRVKENSNFNNIYKQRQTDSELSSDNPDKIRVDSDRREFLKSLFGNS